MKHINKKTTALFALAGTVLATAATTACIFAASHSATVPGYTASSNGRTLYVSNTATSDGDGSKENPYTADKVLAQSESVLKAGDTVYFEPGVYDMKNTTNRVWASGTYNNYITFAKEPDTEGRVVLSFYNSDFLSTNRGVQLDGSYIHWKEIDIRGAGDNGMYIGGSYNIVEDSEFYDNRDSGLQLGRSASDYASIDQWPSYNLIKNCTSFNNYDNETYGENADGFAAKLTVGYGNIFDGCIAYRNSDDGWDLYAKVDSGTIGKITIYNCLSFENGIIAEPRDTFNAKFGEHYDHAYDDATTNPYLTRDGDGNGFKLGGSIMEGEVGIKNSISFHNRMHGVTDNSNPGVISLDGVTSYNNGATVTNDGDVDYTHLSGEDTYGNIDIARQTYSYNTFRNVLSINNGDARLGADAFRGAAANSLLVSSATKSRKINESIDSRDSKKKGTEVDSPAASSVFAELPSMTLGKGNTTIHETLRNSADSSINLGTTLKRTTQYEDDSLGADLNKDSWAAYDHPEYSDLTAASSLDDSVLQAAKDALYIPTDPKNVYQNFNVLTSLLGVDVTWTSSSNILVVGTNVETTISGATRHEVTVNRPLDENKEVTLTATLSYKGITATKDFTILVIRDTPSIGSIEIEGLEDGRFIIDQYSLVPEPNVTVYNASYEDERVLPDTAYTIKRTYTYQEDANSSEKEVHGITTSHAGIFNVTVNVTLNNGASSSTTYQVYVASTRADVEFKKDAEGSSSESITVNKDGFILAGELTSPIGSLHVLSLPKDSEAPSAEKVVAEGKAFDFRNTSISASLENENSDAYDVYYVLCNGVGEVTTDVAVSHVTVVDIASKADLENVLASNNSHTIYRLTADIDCEGSPTTSKNNWVGLFNGMGHTISNVTLSGSGTVGIFPTVKGGTIENVNFSHITINATGDKVGIVSQMYGGYLHNIGLDSSAFTSANRAGVVGQIISQTSDGLTVSEISRIKVTNTTITGTRIGGIVGFVQASSADKYGLISISDCYVNATLGTVTSEGKATSKYVGGIVGRNDDRNKNDSLVIDHCIFAGTAKADTYCGGICGGETGTGHTYIGDSLNLGHLYYAGNTADEVLVAQKNCSPIFGSFAANADCTIRNCYGRFEEYNSNYDVSTLTEADFTNTNFYYDTVGFNSTYWKLDSTAGHLVLTVND